MNDYRNNGQDILSRAQTADGFTTTRAGLSVQAHKVLRNTYLLLSATLAFSALMAFVSSQMNIGMIPWWAHLAGFFGLLFAVEKTKNSALGIVFTFALTGFMGFVIGPLLRLYAANVGSEPIILSLGGTALIFFALSAVALITKRDFGFMGKFLMVGLLVAFVAAIGNIFFQIPALSLAISAVFLVLSSGVILWETSRIVHGGETNYISATVTLFVQLYNIFISLLNLISAFSSD